MKVKDQLSDLRPFTREILPFLLPVLIEQYFISVINSVNTIMISRLGSEEISAIGSVGTFLNMIASFFIALSVGGTILVAKYLGRGQRQLLNQVASLGIAINFLLAAAVSTVTFLAREPIMNGLFGGGDPVVLTYAIDYFAIALFYYVPFSINVMAFAALRGAGDVQTPMKISIFMNLVHVAAAYLLIYGLEIRFFSLVLGWQGFGIRGAAIALLISQFSGMAVVLVVMVKGSRAVRIDLNTFRRFEHKIVTGIFRIGLPTGVEQLILNLGFLIIQTFIVTLSTAEVAAHSIAGSVVFLTNAPALAIATITATIVGRSIGEGDSERARQRLASLQLLTILAFLVSWLVYIPGAPLFVRLYSQDQEAIRIAIPLIITYVIAVTFSWAAAFQVPNGLRAAGDANYPSIISIGCIVLRVLLTYVFIMLLDMNLMAVWIISYADIFLRAVLYTKRRMGHAWLKHMMLD